MAWVRILTSCATSGKYLTSLGLSVFPIYNMGIMLLSSQKCHGDQMNGTSQALQEHLLKKNFNPQDCSHHSQGETTSKNSTVRIRVRDKYLGHVSQSFSSPERGTTSLKGLQVFPSRGSSRGMWGPRRKTGTSRGKLKI